MHLTRATPKNQAITNYWFKENKFDWSNIMRWHTIYQTCQESSAESVSQCEGLIKASSQWLH